MSCEAMRWALHGPAGLAATERLCLMVLADHCFRGTRCWPSQARLAQLTGLGERTIRTALAGLAKRDLIKTVGKRGRTLVYELAITDVRRAPSPAGAAGMDRDSSGVCEGEIPAAPADKDKRLPSGHTSYVPQDDSDESSRGVDQKAKARIRAKGGVKARGKVEQPELPLPPHKAKAVIRLKAKVKPRAKIQTQEDRDREAIGSPEKTLWTTGLLAYRAITHLGQSECKRQIGMLLGIAGGDAARLMAEIVALSQIEGGVDSPIAWIRARLRGLAPPANKAAKGPPKLAHPALSDDIFSAFQYRPRPWLSELTEVEDRSGRLTAGGYYLDDAENLVLERAGLPFNWGGDMRLLAEWLKEGFDLHEHILPAIDALARKPGYQPPSGSLGCFRGFLRR